jgi:hypothetical protein
VSFFISADLVFLVSSQEVVELNLDVRDGLVSATKECTVVVVGTSLVESIVVHIPTNDGEEFTCVVTNEYISA